MYNFSQADTFLIMAAALFLLGMCTLVMGMFILVTRGMAKDAARITAQTAKLMQKGITDELAGLVGNASVLMENVSQLVRTAAGIGIFLTTLGLGMMAAGYWIVLQINW